MFTLLHLLEILSEAREQIKTLQNERQQLMEKVDSLQVQSTDSLKRARVSSNIFIITII